MMSEVYLQLILLTFKQVTHLQYSYLIIDQLISISRFYLNLVINYAYAY